MRSDLWSAAEKAAAESYGREHRFYVLVGHRLVVPGLIVAGLIAGAWMVSRVGWGLLLGYLLLGTAVVAVAAAAVFLVLGSGRRRLSNGVRPPRLPRGM